jgi:hypothetical protein
MPHEKLFQETLQEHQATDRIDPFNGPDNGDLVEGSETKDNAATAKNALNRPQK